MIRTRYTDGGREASGFAHEWNDCGVRALALATDIPYARAHELLKSEGRKDKKGTRTNMIINAVNKIGAKLDDVLVRKHKSTWLGGYSYTFPTLAEVIRQHSTGRFIVVTRSHAMALIDGEIHDKGQISGARSRIKHLYKITLPKQEITQVQINELWARLDKLEGK